jgi:hypothetical protein
MNTRLLVCSMVVAALVSTGPLPAKDKAKATRSKGGKASAAVISAPKPNAGVVVNARQPKAPSASVSISFGGSERDVIRGYVVTCDKGKGLPPGLAKKVARGGSLPPGWEKKCVSGQIMAPDIFALCHPLPPEITIKLPPPPHGTLIVAVHGKVFRLAKATHEILDVFDVH